MRQLSEQEIELMYQDYLKRYPEIEERNAWLKSSSVLYLYHKVKKKPYKLIGVATYRKNGEHYVRIESFRKASPRPQRSH